MAETTVNQSRKSTDVEKLQRAVESMDSLAQQGFSEIAAIAKLALGALQTPSGYVHPETIVQALEVIACKAFDMNNTLNCAAEEVGCNYIDKKLAQRWEARRTAEGRSQSLPPISDLEAPDLKLFH